MLRAWPAVPTHFFVIYKFSAGNTQLCSLASKSLYMSPKRIQYMIIDDLRSFSVNWLCCNLRFFLLQNLLKTCQHKHFDIMK